MKTLTSYMQQMLLCEQDSNNNISTIQIKSKSELLNIINDKGNDKFVDKHGRKGFWLIKEAIKKDDAYINIDKSPWYIQYIAFINDERIIGLMSYSMKHDEENYSPNLHICDIQTLPSFHGLSDKYFDVATEIAKKNHMKYITLRCYEPSLANHYARYGFKMSETNDNCMYKQI